MPNPVSTDPSMLTSLLPYAPLVGGVLGGISNIIGGSISGDAASQAAAEQAQQEQQALDFAKQRYSEAQTNLNPYIQSALPAQSKYAALVAGMSQPSFQDPTQPFNFSTYTDPNAAYDQQQSAQAINGTALARGAVGGGEEKALQSNATNLGNTAFQGAYGRYLANTQMLYNQAGANYQRNFDWNNNQIGQNAQLAGQGLGAAGTLANIGQSASGQVGQIGGELGAAQAGGTMGAGNALASGISGAGTDLASGFNNMAGQATTKAMLARMLGNGAGTSGLGY